MIRSFQSEKELVEYSLKELEKDKWLKAHLYAWTFSRSEIKKAEKELRAMNIEFERNDIPHYDKYGRRAYRIFIFGRATRRATRSLSRGLSKQQLFC